MDLNYRNFDDNREDSMAVDSIPDFCPQCKRTGDQRRLFGREIFSGSKQRLVSYLYQCPSNICREIYAAYYRQIAGTSRFSLMKTDIIRYSMPQEFSDSIKEISPAFIKIYNQALAAEINNLDEISGCGYRRALEFLIKDYLKNFYSEDEIKKTEIENKFLSMCITEYINNDSIKNMAKRAAWLGNDQTHYIKIWEEHDIGDLKNIINLTASYINTELLAKKYTEQMPEK